MKTLFPIAFCFSLSLLLLKTLPAAAFQVTHVPLYTFHGDSVYDKFGQSVSGAGDVNGDGLADLIVGAPEDNNNGSNSGSAWVFSGLDGSLLYTFDGDSQDDNFGTSVSGAGDVNGDGLADLIVGANGDGNNGFGSGSARVLSGFDGSILYTFDGDSVGDVFGISVSGAGDVNGDGLDDLIVGAPRADNNGPLSGSALVLSGLDGSVLYTFDGESIGDRLGWSVSGAGDVNGDGRADLIVGAPTNSTNVPLSGSSRVFSGLDGSILYTFYGDVIGDRLGQSVNGAGDVNGDGLADLIVDGVADSSSDGDGSGSARVLSGLDGSILYTFYSNSANWFGRSVSGAGDVNGDGLADLIVGARSDGNNGNNSGSARVLSGLDGSILYTFHGDNEHDRFGISVSGVGDVNGDGLDDFIVGAETGGLNEGGYARVFVSQVAPLVLLGDVNQDEVVNFLDIGPFISLLSSDTFQIEADINGDGSVTFLDIAPFIAILSSQ